MSYANANSAADARAYAGRVLEGGLMRKDDVHSVQVTGERWEFYGPAWRRVTGADSHYEHHTYRLVNAGWDGASQPIVELHDECGCSWTRDGSARLNTCTACLVR